MPEWLKDLLMVITPTLLSGGGMWWYVRKATRRKAEAEAVQAENQAECIDAEADKIRADAAMQQGEAWQRAFEAFKQGHDREIKALTGQMKYYEDELNGIKAKQKETDTMLRRALSHIQYLMNGIRVLMDQFKRLGVKPDWTPEEWNPDGQ